MNSNTTLFDVTGLDPVYTFLVFKGCVTNPKTRCIYASEDKQKADAQAQNCNVHGWMIPPNFDPKGKTVQEISRKCKFVI